MDPSRITASPETLAFVAAITGADNDGHCESRDGKGEGTTDISHAAWLNAVRDGFREHNFDPNEPRDENGRWTNACAVGSSPTMDFSGNTSGQGALAVAKPIHFQVLSLSPKQQKLVAFAQGDTAREKDLAAILNVLADDIPYAIPHIVNYFASKSGLGKPFAAEEYPGATGFCGACVDFNFPHMPKSTKNLHISKVDFDVARTYQGHNAIRLEFGSDQGINQVAYLDNGWQGGPEHIFFPSDIPAGQLGNETPARLKDGKPAPFASPFPPPTVPRKLTPAEADAAIDRMYHPPGGLRPAAGW